jgi:hypothetical protein
MGQSAGIELPASLGRDQNSNAKSDGFFVDGAPESPAGFCENRSRSGPLGTFGPKVYWENVGKTFYEISPPARYHFSMVPPHDYSEQMWNKSQ